MDRDETVMAGIAPAIVRQAARLACTAIYDPVDERAFARLHRIGESVCGLALQGDLCYLAMQGTELQEVEGDRKLHFSLQGWAADFHCSPIVHPVLGQLHSGFHQNLPALLPLLMAELPAGARVVVTGHSKGAGEAALLGALLKLAGVDVVAAVLFACPRPGFRQLADWLAANVPGVSFRNAPARAEAFGDPVAMVPPDPFVAPYPLTYVDVAPPGMERLMSVEWHQAALYIAGVDALR